MDATAPSMTRAIWADKITKSWQKAVASIIETGRLLIEAKGELPGQWLAMIDRDLPFDRTTAYRLMAIAEHPVLSDVAHGQHLPPSWRTLYELTKLPKDVLLAKIASGEISPRTQRKDVKAMRKAIKGVEAKRKAKVMPPSPRSKDALDEAADWFKGKAEADEITTVISWLEQFEAEQLIAVLRTGSAEDTPPRPLEDVFRHYDTQYGKDAMLAAFEKLYPDAALRPAQSVPRRTPRRRSTRARTGARFIFPERQGAGAAQFSFFESATPRRPALTIHFDSMS